MYGRQRHTNLIFEMIVGALARSNFYADEALGRLNKSLFISVGRIYRFFDAKCLSIHKILVKWQNNKNSRFLYNAMHRKVFVKKLKIHRSKKLFNGTQI